MYGTEAQILIVTLEIQSIHDGRLPGSGLLPPGYPLKLACYALFMQACHSPSNFAIGKYTMTVTLCVHIDVCRCVYQYLFPGRSQTLYRCTAKRKLLSCI